MLVLREHGNWGMPLAVQVRSGSVTRTYEPTHPGLAVSYAGPYRQIKSKRQKPVSVPIEELPPEVRSLLYQR